MKVCPSCSRVIIVEHERRQSARMSYRADFEVQRNPDRLLVVCPCPEEHKAVVSSRHPVVSSPTIRSDPRLHKRRSFISQIQCFLKQQSVGVSERGPNIFVFVVGEGDREGGEEGEGGREKSSRSTWLARSYLTHCIN